MKAVVENIGEDILAMSSFSLWKPSCRRKLAVLLAAKKACRRRQPGAKKEQPLVKVSVWAHGDVLAIPLNDVSLTELVVTDQFDVRREAETLPSVSGQPLSLFERLGMSLSKPASIHKLTVRSCNFPNCQQLAWLRCPQEMYELALEDCIGFKGADALKFLPTLKSLQRLTLDGCPRVTDEALALLQGLPRLETLELRHCFGLQTGHFLYFGPNLRELRLESVFSKYTNWVDPVRAAAQLATLELRGMASAGRFSTLGWLLSGLPSLTNFSVIDCPVSVWAFRESLQGRRVASVAFSVTEATDQECQQLSSLPSLHKLWLKDAAAVGDRGLQLLAATPGLKELELHGCGPGLRCEGLAELQSFNWLERLRLAFCPTTALNASGVDALLACRSLTQLGIVADEMSDTILQQLAKSEALHELQLPHTTRFASVPSDEGLSALRNCRSLQALVIQHNNRLTGAGSPHWWLALRCNL